MPKFSNFSVWDKEVKKLITDIHDRAGLPEEELSDWFYSEGLIQFQQAQSDQIVAFTTDELKRTNKRPEITTEYMSNNKKTGFEQVKNTLLQKYLDLEADKKTNLIELYDTFALNAVTDHQAFLALQAAITTALYAKLDAGENVMPAIFVKEEFEQAMLVPENEALVAGIQAHLILMEEYGAYKQQQRLASSSTAAIIRSAPPVATIPTHIVEPPNPIASLDEDEDVVRTINDINADFTEAPRDEEYVPNIRMS